MKIKRLQTSNFRNLYDTEIDFTNPNGNIRSFTVLIGNNSTGKTAILEAIAKTLVPSVRGGE